MISPRHRAIFFHVGKTAGTSVERWLIPVRFDPYKPIRKLMVGWDSEEGIFLHHATCATVHRLIGGEAFATYYKFAVVREPYARLRSVYLYLEDAHRKQFGDFRRFILALPNLIAQPRTRPGSHLLPQTEYTDLNGVRVVDHVVRFESLEKDLQPVARRLGIERPLEHINRRKRISSLDGQSLCEVYDEAMIEVMQAVYGGDFRAFGYPERPISQVATVRGC